MLLFVTRNLKAMAKFIQDEMFEAHRGAVVHGIGTSVIIFGNDGHHDEPVGKSALEKTRDVLAADGYELGEVVLTKDRYTWVFEVVPPTGVSPDDAAERCDEAVWEGWAAARDLDPHRDAFAVLQRSIAMGVTGSTLVELAAATI